MTVDGPTIVIEGMREDWPGGAPRPQPGTQPPDFLVRRRTRPGRRPGVFRESPREAVRRMRAWLTPDRQLEPDLNRPENAPPGVLTTRR